MELEKKKMRYLCRGSIKFEARCREQVGSGDRVTDGRGRGGLIDEGRASRHHNKDNNLFTASGDRLPSPVLLQSPNLTGINPHH